MGSREEKHKALFQVKSAPSEMDKNGTRRNYIRINPRKRKRYAIKLV